MRLEITKLKSNTVKYDDFLDNINDRLFYHKQEMM